MLNDLYEEANSWENYQAWYFILTYWSYPVILKVNSQKILNVQF